MSAYLTCEIGFECLNVIKSVKVECGVPNTLAQHTTSALSLFAPRFLYCPYTDS